MKKNWMKKAETNVLKLKKENTIKIMDLPQQFELAVTDSKKLAVRPDNETMLQLYSLFKQATHGDQDTEPPSNPFDFVAKAKFQAWSSLKGKTKEDAMKEYISLVEKLKNN